MIPDKRTEKEIQHGIRKVLEALGFAVWNLSQPRNSMQAPGLADLYITGHGVTAWAEIKRPKGKQSPAQEVFQAEVQDNGGRYVLWWSETQAIEWAREMMVRAGRRVS